jgi:hypothetical protein
VDNENNTEKWIDEINSIMKNTQENETSNMPINGEPNLLWEQFDSKVSQIRTTGISASLLIRQYLEMPYLNRTKNLFVRTVAELLKNIDRQPAAQHSRTCALKNIKKYGERRR